MFEFWMNRLANRLAPSQYTSLSDADRRRAFNTSLADTGLALVDHAGSGDLTDILRAMQAGTKSYQSQLGDMEEERRKLAADDQRRKLTELQMKGAENDLETDAFNKDKRTRELGELITGRKTLSEHLDAWEAAHPDAEAYQREQVARLRSLVPTETNLNALNDDLTKLEGDLPEAQRYAGRIASDIENYKKLHGVDRAVDEEKDRLDLDYRRAAIKALDRRGADNGLTDSQLFTRGRAFFNEAHKSWADRLKDIQENTLPTQKAAAIAALGSEPKFEDWVPDLEGNLPARLTSTLNGSPVVPDPAPHIGLDPSVTANQHGDRLFGIDAFKARMPQVEKLPLADQAMIYGLWKRRPDATWQDMMEFLSRKRNNG